MKSIIVLQIANVVAYLVTLLFNFLAQGGSALGIEVFQGTVGDLAEGRAIFFLPAGYVFAIWGLIYLATGAFVVYQARASQRDNPIIRKIGWWFVLTCIGNIGWLVLFLNNQLLASTVAILLILVSLIAIYLRLDIGRTAVSSLEHWVVHIPFSIYLGWVSVATIANFAALFYDYGNVTGLLGISADIWTIIVMVVAAILALLMIFRRGDIAYALVVIWALVGIYARSFQTDVYDVLAGQNIALVNNSAIGLSLLIAAAIVIYLFTNRQQVSERLPLTT